jgi:hypothetical protein
MDAKITIKPSPDCCDMFFQEVWSKRKEQCLEEPQPKEGRGVTYFRSSARSTEGEEFNPRTSGLSLKYVCSTWHLIVDTDEDWGEELESPHRLLIPRHALPSSSTS